MATAVRNTGTRFRYDADDNLWHVKLRAQVIDADGEHFLEFVTKVATLVELLAWIADTLGGLSLAPGYTVAGVPEGTYSAAVTLSG